jgi:hypothetical protein
MAINKYLIAFPFLLLMICNNIKAQEQKVVIDVDFPGGNIIVNGNKNTSTLYYKVTDDTISVRPDLRDTEGNWFYWYFRVTGAADKTLYFQFPGNHISSFGPAFSADGGKSWEWLHDEVQENHNSFSYTFGQNENEVLFSLGIPYLQSNFDEFIALYKDNNYVSIEMLTISKKGRNIEKVTMRNPNGNPNYKILITARHHACEMMASYALEGIIASVLEGNDNNMKWLRENVEFLIVPFMDKDGVEDGDQGKNRMPRDHNRDYSEISVHNSTAALREKIPEWSHELLKIGLDLHCPGIVGNWHEHIYSVGAENKTIAYEQTKFIQILVEQQQGELKINPKNSFLEFGKSWNVTNTFNKGLSFRGWVSSIKGVSLAISFELPYANNNGQQVTINNASVIII